MTGSTRDVSEDLTVFVTTIGDQTNFDECMSCLRSQSVKFSLNLIEHVAPMSAAFNQMIERCQTRWFVQVDEDMLLFESAIEQLFDLMRSADQDVACIGAPLWDCQIERPIYGVKVYRHDLVQGQRFQDTRSCDLDLHDRLASDGYRVVELPLRWSRESCLGEHGKHYTARTAYLRWKRLFEKRRELGGKDWILPWPRRFLESYRKSGSEVDLYSFLGAVVGLTGTLPQGREYNYEDPLEDFENLAAAMANKQALLSGGHELLERPREWRLRLKQWFMPEWRRSKR